MTAPALPLLRGWSVCRDVLRVFRLPSLAGGSSLFLQLAPLAHGQHALLQLLPCPLLHKIVGVPGTATVGWLGLH